MKLKKLTWMVLMFLLMGMIVFSGCGDGDDSPTSPGNPLDVSGTWTIHATGYSIMTAVLTHTGTTITGTVSTPDNTAETISGTTEAAAGTTTSRKVILDVKFLDWMGSITMTGTVSDDNTSMSGNYVDNSGGVGTWTATRQ